MDRIRGREPRPLQSPAAGALAALVRYSTSRLRQNQRGTHPRPRRAPCVPNSVNVIATVEHFRRGWSGVLEGCGMIDPQTRLLALFFASLKEILEITLVEAAKSKGHDGLAWLDRYESEIIFQAKQTHTHGMSFEDEAHDVGALIDVLKLIFATARGRLAERTDGD
jgi:hypothetical protein